MPLLVGLLVVTFAIAADLAHEAWSNARSRQRTAERAGRDLVRYTATSTAYETRTALDHALHALFAPIATRTSRDRADIGVERLMRSAAHVRDCKCAPAITARYYFQLRLSDGALQLKGASEPSTAERQWLADAVVARARSVWRSDWDYALLSGVVDGQRRVVGYAPNRDGGDSSVSGFVSEVAALREALSTPRPRASTRREPD